MATKRKASTAAAKKAVYDLGEMKAPRRSDLVKAKDVAAAEKLEPIPEVFAKSEFTKDDIAAALAWAEKKVGGPIDLLGMYQNALAAVARSDDTPETFAAYFELMHGSPLNSEGVKWIAKAYDAHSRGKKSAHKCHRESGKTTVFSKFFLSYRIGKEPYKTNAVIRINDEKANETTAAVAQIIAHDPRWKLVFRNVVPDEKRGWGAGGYFVKDESYKPEQWAEIKTKGPDGPTFVGYGWKSGSIIGSRWNGIVDVDDIHDEENTSSERQLNAVKKFYTDTFTFCVMDGAWEIWNYTPWLTNDVYAFIEATGMYEVSVTPVMVAADENTPGATFWERETDIPVSGRWYVLYWPERWDFPRIGDKYRTAGALGFARMMLLDLEATKGINLKAEWLHEYPASEIKASWPVIFGVDYASTMDKIKDKERDYFALAIKRIIPGGGLVLVDGYRGHVSKSEALALVAGYAGMYPTLIRVGVETIGKGEEFYNDLLLSVDVAGKPLPLLPITHGKRSKGDRFENWLAPRYQASRLWISDIPTPFVQQFRNEWLTWPNTQHDDCLDADYMASAAGEGFMPSKAERTLGMNREKPAMNPIFALGRK